jgi:signal transduction histidine kinase
MDIQLTVPINDLYVFADKSQIIRVLNNIVKNAIQAIPKSRRGLIHIKLEFTDEWVMLSVQDNGVGIDEHMRKRGRHDIYYRIAQAYYAGPIGYGDTR